MWRRPICIRVFCWSPANSMKHWNMRWKKMITISPANVMKHKILDDPKIKHCNLTMTTPGVIIGHRAPNFTFPWPSWPHQPLAPGGGPSGMWGWFIPGTGVEPGRYPHARRGVDQLLGNEEDFFRHRSRHVTCGPVFFRCGQKTVGNVGFWTLELVGEISVQFVFL